LAIRESDTRKTLEKPRKRQTCMLLKLPQVVGQLGKFKDSQEYHPLVKVCMGFSRYHNLLLFFYMNSPIPFIFRTIPRWCSGRKSNRGGPITTTPDANHKSATG